MFNLPTDFDFTFYCDGKPFLPYVSTDNVLNEPKNLILVEPPPKKAAEIAAKVKHFKYKKTKKILIDPALPITTTISFNDGIEKKIVIDKPYTNYQLLVTKKQRYYFRHMRRIESQKIRRELGFIHITDPKKGK
jgi:hypothetical protein